MNNQGIKKAIESHHWDYPIKMIPKDLEYVNNEDIIMIKNRNVPNIQANKIVHFSKYASLDSVLSFFQDVPFSWWAPLGQQNLIERLKKNEFSLIDTYIGLAFHLQQFAVPKLLQNFSFYDVKTEKEIEHLVNVSSTIWGYAATSKPTIIQQRKMYLEQAGDQGGFIICCDGDIAVGYANYRYSQDRKILYLNGSGVLPTYRKQGIYTQLVYKRLQLAKKRGTSLATCQARTGHSAPILKKLGFTEYETYLQFAKNINS
ncbi:GNAT family N-acetyltransferase [Bacillus cereus]|uniref:GNAT family N-acetyltransferase n=1 Tax=Bacillus cereus TaxID=1396 RepID=UPI000BF39870|nr:GNAT family N-acetyltransferase [Bacillus cereus]PFR20550.1 GNAT family N-acetyltransferase [Bacillus cereus]